MVKIGIISDTHGFIHPGILDFFKDVDEIWHAGDIGDETLYNRLLQYKPVKAVFGNIDGLPLRTKLHKTELFVIENLTVLLTHIAGKPGKYNNELKALMTEKKPGMLVCGHSHILKVMFDQNFKLLYINPGAGGRSGFHHVITAVRLKISNGVISDLDIYEIERNTL